MVDAYGKCFLLFQVRLYSELGSNRWAWNIYIRANNLVYYKISPLRNKYVNNFGWWIVFRDGKYWYAPKFAPTKYGATRKKRKPANIKVIVIVYQFWEQLPHIPKRKGDVNLIEYLFKPSFAVWNKLKHE